MATATVRCVACVVIAAAFILHGCGDNDEATTLVATEGTNAAATPNSTTPSLRPRAPTQDIRNNKTENITNAAAKANKTTEDIPNEDIKNHVKEEDKGVQTICLCSPPATRELGLPVQCKYPDPADDRDGYTRPCKKSTWTEAAKDDDHVCAKCVRSQCFDVAEEFCKTNGHPKMTYIRCRQTERNKCDEQKRITEDQCLTTAWQQCSSLCSTQAHQCLPFQICFFHAQAECAESR